MNKFPVILDIPDTEFVIVGPKGYTDGILIKTKEIELGLIAASSVVYSEGIESENVDEIDSDNYSFIWSDPISYVFDEDKEESEVEEFYEARKFKILLCWKVKNSFTSYLSKKDDKIIRDKFKKISFDLFQNMYYNFSSEEERTLQILWIISPIANILAR